MATNIHSGSEGIIYVGSTAVASIRSFSLEETQETIDATTMSTSGVAFRTNKATFSSWSGSLDVYWTTEDTSVDAYGTEAATASHVEAGSDPLAEGSSTLSTPATADGALFGILKPGKEEVTIHFWPAGDDAGELGYSAKGIITGRTISSSVDGMIEASITVLGTEALATEVSGYTGLTAAAT